MKYFNFKLKLRAVLAVFMLLAIGAFANAQKITVTGSVKDATSSEPIIGASILEKGTTNGTVTDVNGQFSISVSSNATLVVQYVGYKTQEVPVANQKKLSIKLSESAVSLNEVVAIGYGTVKKKDLTGSVVAISTDKLNKGLATSFTDMLAGKMAGVSITTAGGAPGTNATIRIRGGSSMSASNDPLYVIDGVPIDGSSVEGIQNPLADINPQDIATFTVLKDASATAIYGSRASNGVILITTKKANLKSKFSVSYNGNASVSSIDKQIGVLSADQYRTFIKDYWGTNSVQASLLGTANTDWQSQIYQTATSQDHNISVSGHTGNLPYRVSVGYTDQNGVLKTSSFKRATATVNLNPTFLNNDLKVNLNIKGSSSHSRFADVGAIGAALEYDPTQPVYNLNADGTPALKYGNGYSIWIGSNGYPINIATANPLSVLTSKDDEAQVYQSLGNLQLDYSYHGFKDLKAHLNVAYDLSKSNGSTTILANSPMSFVWGDHKIVGSGPSEDSQYYQFKSNTLFEFYLNYNKQFGIQSLDAMAGYSFQHFYNTNWNTIAYSDAPDFLLRHDTPSEYYLLSFYGRVNYSLMDKYLLTVNLRNDGSSRFDPSNRWGLFPSVALAWRIKQEAFLKDVTWLNDLKLRLGYGVTGQQDVGTNYYTYIPTFTTSSYDDAMYQFGSDFYHLIRPDGYNAGLKWESTATYNAGVDLVLFDNRLTASVDVYNKLTSNLLNTIPIPAGSNFTNMLLTNIGDLENKGVEVTIGGRIIQTRDFTWAVNYTFSHNQNKITKLSRAYSADYGVPEGSISGGTGNKVLVEKVGYPVNSFYVYKQVYDANGNPIEGAYKNVGTSDNKYVDHSPAPKYIMGFSSRMDYKNWYLNFSLRSNIGNYVYNNVQSRLEFKNNTYDSSGFLKNIVPSGLTTNFANAQYLSDYYVQNASFLKMDNITLGYNFKKLFTSEIAGSLYGTVQNVFTITGYKGLDPEVDGGIDNNIYPRPKVFLLGLRLNF